MVDELLARLDKVKSTGNRKWTACCPVHGDKNPSMSIKEESDGKVLCYCFACGAKGVDVVGAIGLPVSVLFSEESKSPDRSSWRKQKLLEEKASDELFLRIYTAWEEAGKVISWADQKRYKVAVNRLEGINLQLAEINC
jgi:hypothetical protein